MNKVITDWAKDVLYPAIFDQIDSIFPELDFRRTSTGWQSPFKLDGSDPKQPRRDKTVITKKMPGSILEQGGESLSLADYVMRRDQLTNFYDTVEYLASKLGLQVPKGDFDLAKYEANKQRDSLLQQAANYFSFCLLKAPRAQPYRDYLQQERGYSIQEIEQMQLGFIPSQEKLTSNLTDRGFTQDQIKEALNIQNDSRIGSSHQLVIPFQAKGQILGFKFRAVDPSQTPKYLNSKGLDKTQFFFNLSSLKGTKDLIIVEGELDCLIAEAKGVDNVVATAGSNISERQIESALHAGARMFTICFDSELGADKKVLRAIKQLRSKGLTRIYIAELPSLADKTDPDSFIKARGADAFKHIIKEAQPYYIYQLNNLFDRYSRQAEGDSLTAKQIDEFKADIVQLGASLPLLDRDSFISDLLQAQAIQDLGITKESLEITTGELAANKLKEQQKKELKNALQTATNELSNANDPEKALKQLQSKIEAIKQNSSVHDFQSLLAPTTQEQIFQEEADMPEGLDSGLEFTMQGEEPINLRFPGGALTIFAAPTSHGKTRALINSVLNVAQANKEQEFYFFTYEERANKIVQYLLNTYIDIPVSANNTKSLQSYFTQRSDEFIKTNQRRAFNEKKDQFFKEFIEPGRINIKYTDKDSASLCNAIRYIQRERPNLGGIFIDYFQLLHLPADDAKSKNSRQEELKQICLTLKDLAVETGLPIILAAQFNREVTSPLKIHPTNIGEAGDIERIANTIIGLWNGAFRIKTSKENKSDKRAIASLLEIQEAQIEEPSPKPGYIYMEILKSRELSTGWSNLFEFNGNTGKISNLSKQNKSNRAF